MLKRWLREPLVHFLALGALLFLAFQWWGSSPQRIVITPGQQQALATQFERVWQRAPTDAELKRLVDEQVRAEIAAREASALGLDRDDVVIQRRLRQKLEFLAEETIDGAPPTDAELQAYLDAHPGKFRAETEAAFRQAYFKSVEVAHAALAAGGDPGARGERIMLPEDVALSPLSDIARRFGREFAEQLEKLPLDRWAGPVRSGFGAHLVLVRERRDGRLPALAEIRPLVERELQAQRRRQALDAMYERLLQKYEVVIQ